MKKNWTQVVTFKEHPDLVKKIDQIATSRGRSRSSYVREAVREKLAHETQ